MPHLALSRGRLYFEIHGDTGPWIVLVHGGGGNCLTWWLQVPALSERHRLLLLDLPTFGRSADFSPTFDPAQVALDLLALLDAQKIERAILVCHSLGGWVGLRLARDRPSRCDGLVLSASPAGLDTARIRALVRKAGEASARRSYASLPAALALGAQFRRRAPKRTFLYDQISNLNPIRASGAFGQIGGTAGLIDPSSLADLAVPTLVIGGGDDRFLGPGFDAYVADLIPGAEAVTFDGVGHSPYYEQPERFNEAVLAVAARHAQGATSP